MSPAVDRSGPVDQRPGREAVPGSQGGRRDGRRRRGRRSWRPRRRALDGAGGRVHLVLRPSRRQGRRRGRTTSRPTSSSAAWRPARRCWRAGADLTDRPALRTHRAARGDRRPSRWRSSRLVHDLGRPSRFLNMLRVAKPTSPMSVGTWILTAYGPARRAGRRRPSSRPRCCPPAPARRPGRAAARAVRPAGRPGRRGRWRPAVASYTAVLLTDTATPSWHEAHRAAAVRLRRLGRGRLGRPRHDRRARRTRPARPGGWPSAARCSSWPPSTGWSRRWASPPSRCTRAAPAR